MPDEAKEAKAPEPEEKKGGSGKLFLFSGVGLAVIIGAAFLFATFAVPVVPDGQDDESTAATGEPTDREIAPPQIYDVPVILVNVKGTSKKRILKIHLNMVYESHEGEAEAVYIDSKMPEIKDALNTLLSEKTLEELEGKDAMNLLRIQMLDELNRVVYPQGDGAIQRVYYEEFIVQ